MKTITAATALEALREVVSEEGSDYIYPDKSPSGSCYYIKPGTKDTPSCGVGRALRRLGVSIDFLRGAEGVGAWSLSNLHSNITSEACEVLSKFQEYQDELRPWGFCLGEAEGRFEELKREAWLG